MFFIAQQALENNVLVPKVLGKQVGLSAVTVIIALAIGSELLGLVGALLAVPTAAIVQVLVEELVLHEESRRLKNQPGPRAAAAAYMLLVASCSPGRWRSASGATCPATSAIRC